MSEFQLRPHIWASGHASNRARTRVFHTSGRVMAKVSTRARGTHKRPSPELAAKKAFVATAYIWHKQATIHDQVVCLSTVYVKHGEKSKRWRDVTVAIRACNWIAREYSINDVHRVGSKHAVAYWRAHRGFDDLTLLTHWRAFGIFYTLLGRQDEPPMPRTMQPLGC
jgi:hypothetical protein